MNTSSRESLAEKLKRIPSLEWSEEELSESAPSDLCILFLVGICTVFVFMVICHACPVELFRTKVLILSCSYCTNISCSFIVPTAPSNLGINLFTLSMSALVYVSSWIDGKLFSRPWSKRSDTLYMQISGWSRTILLIAFFTVAPMPSANPLPWHDSRYIHLIFIFCSFVNYWIIQNIFLLRYCEVGESEMILTIFFPSFTKSFSAGSILVNTVPALWSVQSLRAAREYFLSWLQMYMGWMLIWSSW